MVNASPKWWLMVVAGLACAGFCLFVSLHAMAVPPPPPPDVVVPPATPPPVVPSIPTPVLEPSSAPVVSEPEPNSSPPVAPGVGETNRVLVFSVFLVVRGPIFHRTHPNPRLERPALALHGESRAAFARLHNYTYVTRVENMTAEIGDPHWYKVTLLRQFLAEMDGDVPRWDWVAYLDWDTFVAQPARTLESMVSALESRLNIRCDMLAQEMARGEINTGFLLVRNTEWSKGVVSEWDSLRSHPTVNARLGGPRGWQFEQGPFQDVVLSHAAEHVDKKYPPHDCLRPGVIQHGRDCYVRNMRWYGLSHCRSSFPHFCFFCPSRPNERMNFHNGFNRWRRGDWLFHAPRRSPDEALANWPVEQKRTSVPGGSCCSVVLGGGEGFRLRTDVPASPLNGC